MFTFTIAVCTSLLAFCAIWLIMDSRRQAEHIAELTQQRDHMADEFLKLKGWGQTG